jgi:hypothetical protein
LAEKREYWGVKRKNHQQDHYQISTLLSQKPATISGIHLQAQRQMQHKKRWQSGNGEQDLLPGLFVQHDPMPGKYQRVATTKRAAVHECAKEQLQLVYQP